MLNFTTTILILAVTVICVSAPHLTAQSDTITYVSISDSCKRLIILPDGKIFMPSRCDESINFIETTTLNGGMVHEGRQVYEKKKVLSCPTNVGEEIFQLSFEDSDIQVDRISLINRDSFMIITGVKSLPGIDCHYVGSSVLERSDKIGCFKPDPNDGPLEIYIEKYEHNSYIQLAMDQASGDVLENADSGRVYIRNGQYGKTVRRSNPEDFVSGKYHFYLVNKDAESNWVPIRVPAIFASIPTIWMPLEDRVKAIEMYQPLIGDSPYFISCYRFNPSRDHVNETFGEEVEGNVLPFVIYSVVEYLEE